LYGAEGQALDIAAEACGVHQSTLEDDNGLWDCIGDATKSIFDAAIVSIASHPDYRPTDPEMWHRVLDVMRSVRMPAVAVNAHVQSQTGPEWEKDGRASDVPATKLDLSKSLFPPKPDGLDRFDETVASERGAARVDFADVKAATLRSLDYIIPRLLPGGKRVGDEWVVRNPTRDDKKARSFSVNMRTGVWCDFATGETGGDMIDLYAYLNRGSNVQAKDALAEMLNVQARSGSTSNPTTTPPKRSAIANPSDLHEPPRRFPARTPPDKDGKPIFIVAGDEGPPARGNELRRHVYRRGNTPVRIKIIKKDGKGALNAYRVSDADGVTGWQYKKPEGFQPIPYFIPSADPFIAVIDQPIFWTEGEKDVETVVGLGGLAFTFGGVGDGLPDGCEQFVVGRRIVILADNDKPGREHAEKKAALASNGATSVKIVHFRELEEKQDVSDWAAITGNTLVALTARVEQTDPWQAVAMAAGPGSDIKLSDFQAFLPQHSYIYIPTRDLWPAGAVNAVVPSIPLFNLDGSPRMSEGKQVHMKATTWLDTKQAVEQMTWAPGLPMLIRERLISEGGWLDHPGAACFNLYRPPTMRHGDPTKAGRWVDHVKRVYPDYWDHIIKWLAHRVQHPEIKINHCLVLGGKPGVGKDTLLGPVVQAVGPWNCADISPETLFAPFTGFLKAVVLRVSEARDMGDVSKFQLYERMKTMNAAPPDVLRVNEKHLREHYIVNVVGAIITTNYRTEGLYLPADDRRHYVCWSELNHSDFDSEPGANDASTYFDDMWRWYEKEGGFEEVAAYLATLDISGFNPKAPPPKTPAFWAIVDANRPPEESEIADVLDLIGNPPALTIERLAASAEADLSAFLRDKTKRKAAKHRIEAAGYEIVRNDVAQDGLWVVNVDGVKARKTIYARNELSLKERMKAAHRVADGDTWHRTDGVWDWVPRPR
jgi:hypothetical protein